MRRIAIINQKGGVGKTTTTANLGAALAEQGRRVVLVDMDAQANLSLSFGVEAEDGSPTSYSVLVGETPFASALRATSVPNLSLVASHIDLSGAEMELASQIGREFLLRDALEQWVTDERARTGRAPADYVLFDCPPSLGLLSINALASAGEVLITLQTEFLALQGMSKLVGVVQLLRKRLNPELVVTGILPCLYESRLRLAREVLGEIRKYFPGQVLPVPIRANVKLAEAPSFGQTIFQYAPESIGAMDYRCAAREMLRMETRDPDLAGLPPFREAVLAGTTYAERATDHAARAVVRESAPVAPVAASAPSQVATPAAPVKSSKRAPPASSTPATSAESKAGDSRERPLPPPAVQAKKTAPVVVAAPVVAAPVVAAPLAKAPVITSPVVATPRVVAPPSATPPAASPTRVMPSAAVREPRAPAKKLAPTAPNVPANTAKTPAKEKRARRAPPVAARAITPAAPKPAAEPAPVKRASPPAKTPRAALSPEATAPAPRVAPAPAAVTPTPPTPVTSAPVTSTPAATTNRAPAPKPKRAPAVTITPAPKPPSKRGASATPPSATSARATAASPAAASTPARDEARVVRADELPPLPPDAFEILASFGLDP